MYIITANFEKYSPDEIESFYSSLKESHPNDDFIIIPDGYSMLQFIDKKNGLEYIKQIRDNLTKILEEMNGY